MRKDYYYYNIEQKKMIKVIGIEKYKYSLISFISIVISILLIWLHTLMITDKFNLIDQLELENCKFIGEIDSLKNIVIILNETDSFSEKELIMMLNGLNMFFPEVVLAQSKLETNNYTSDMFLVSGNLFGMKPARHRPNTHYGEYKGHADYLGNWRLSVIDYALWQSREVSKSNIKTVDDYLTLLKLKGYAEDEEYVLKVKKLIVN